MRIISIESRKHVAHLHSASPIDPQLPSSKCSYAKDQGSANIVSVYVQHATKALIYLDGGKLKSRCELLCEIAHKLKQVCMTIVFERVPSNANVTPIIPPEAKAISMWQ